MNERIYNKWLTALFWLACTLVLLVGCKAPKTVFLNGLDKPCELTDSQFRNWMRWRRDSIKTVEKWNYKYSRDTIRLTKTIEKYRIKFDEKRFKDSLKFIQKKYHDSLIKYPKIIREKARIERKEIRAKGIPKAILGISLVLLVIILIIYSLIRKA